MKFDITTTFKTENKIRDNFLSRVFGIFSEEILRLWCKNPKSKYEDLGRPSLYKNDKYTKTTLDFCLRDNKGNIFIAEQKCLLAYQNYQFLELTHKSQIDRHRKKDAFENFIEVAKKPNSYEVKVDGEKVNVAGSILIWGSINKEKKEALINEFMFYDILSIEDMVNDLIEWKDKEYEKFISEKLMWISDLMNSLSVCKNL